ncbi:MAG: serine/threonine protein kinase [Polyangiaceae bacterium]|nr:serine/threonine protein kinase [Polyangiaceae bacterium]
MSDDLKRGSRLGRYELLLRIGRGGMATVWVARERAEQREDERLVAIKAILPELNEDPEFVKMFLDEGRLVRSIRHENVVAVYDVAELDGVMCMVMEWIEGDSLHTLIAEAGKRKPVPPELAVRMIADAAAGLHAAHEAKDEKGELLGVVHRDVSPHNILIGTDGSVKLVDFGVAKAMGRITEATSAGQLKGKFGYMSPEQAMAKPVDRRADVFALGIVLFELTTGRRLFRGEHDAETLHLVVSGEIPAPTSLDAEYPKALETIVLKALERDLGKRYQTAEELQRDLEGYLKSERIVVARAGLGALLKRVLGDRIDQRRKAVRATLRQLDGGDAAPLASAPDSAATGAGDSTGSGISQLGGPASSTSGLSHTSSSGVSAVQPPPRRSSLGGYVVGIGGLVVALGAVAAVALTRRPQTTVVQPPVVAATPESTEAARPSGAPARAPAADDGVAVTDLSALGPAQAGGAAPRASAAASAAGRPAEKPSEKPKPAAPAAPGPAGLPRANPYGN